MPRTYKQVILAREEDNVRARGAGLGTSTATIPIVNGNDIIYATDIAVSNTVAAKLSVLNGTAYMFGPLDIPANPNPPFSHNFSTPLKCSAGTACNAILEGVQAGVMNVNLTGYTRNTI